MRLVASAWEGSSAREVVDGLQVFRGGGRYTFPAYVRSVFESACRGTEIDLVIEDINKLPLYSPLWAGRPVAGLVPHLFGTTAFREVKENLSVSAFALYPVA